MKQFNQTENNLIHISPSSKLEGIWNPRSPYTEDIIGEISDNNDPFPYPEPLTPRISLSSHLEGAMHAIYPNHREHIIENKAKELNFHVYSPVELNERYLVNTETLLKNEWVWDAHITDEYWYTKKVTMKLIGEVTYYIDGDRKREVRPFNKVNLPLITFNELIIIKTEFRKIKRPKSPVKWLL